MPLRHIYFSVKDTGIVSNLLKAMNSEIQVQSEYGKGSNFYFTLEQCVVNDNNIGSFEQKRKSLMTENMNYTGFVAPNARILIIDDLEINLSVACALLEHLQMQIDTAQSGRIAIETEQELLDFLKRAKVVAEHFDMMEFMAIEEDASDWDVEEHNKAVYNKMMGFINNTAFLDAKRFLDELGI